MSTTIRLTASGDALVSDLRSLQSFRRLYHEEYFPQTSERSLGWLLQIIQSYCSDGHFPSTLHEDILQEAGIESSFHVDTLDLPLRLPTALRRDPNFRLNILKAYEYKCAVCGFDVKLRNQPVALEALPYQVASGRVVRMTDSKWIGSMFSTPQTV